MLIQSATITESTSRTLKAANGYIFPLPTEKNNKQNANSLHEMPTRHRKNWDWKRQIL